jgi:hypothetical protein
MFPGFWGFLFWKLLHCSAKSFPAGELSADGRIMINAFLPLLCRYLPCPNCRYHCTLYVKEAATRPINTGDDYWRYTVDFHNAVNLRTDKTTLSYDQAEALLTDTFGYLPGNRVQVSFAQDFWSVLLWTTFTYAQEPNQATAEERTAYREFLRLICYVLPFSRERMLGTEVATTIYEHFATTIAAEAGPFALRTRNEAFDAVLALHNSVCGQFSTLPLTREEMYSKFSAYLTQANKTEIVRSLEVRIEDHKRISALEAELVQARSNSGSSNSGSSNSGSSNSKSPNTTTHHQISSPHVPLRRSQPSNNYIIVVTVGILLVGLLLSGGYHQRHAIKAACLRLKRRHHSTYQHPPPPPPPLLEEEQTNLT